MQLPRKTFDGVFLAIAIIQIRKIMTTENLPQLTDEYCLKEYGWTKNRFEVIKRTYFKDLSNDDIAVFGHVCKHVGLDPFLKQIYPVVRMVKDRDGIKKPTMSIQTGIDGFRATAERTRKYSPGKEPLFKYDKDGRLFSATAYVMKMTDDGKWHEVAATAIMSEYRPTFQNDFWASKPHIMLSKCAEALAIRKAFPAELSGVYTKEEMDQADKEEKLPEAEYETVTHRAIDKNNDSLLTLNQENKHDLCGIDTKTSHFEDDTNLKQDVVTFDQVTEIMKKFALMDAVSQRNFKEKVLPRLGVTEMEHLPADAYQIVMNSIESNLKLNKVKSCQS